MLLMPAYINIIKICLNGSLNRWNAKKTIWLKVRKKPYDTFLYTNTALKSLNM